MKIVLLFLLFSNVYLFAQTPDQGVSYLDFNNKPTSKEKAVFYAFKTVYKDSLWKYQKYYIPSNTKAFLVEKYYYDQTGQKQGKYSFYYKDGIIKNEGIYKDNKKFGPWKKYRKAPFISLDSIDNSVYLQSLKYYKEDKINGNFKEFYYDGSIQGEGQYKNDNLYGECKWYHENGQISSLEFYDEKGKLKKIQQWNENGVERTKKLKPNHDIKANIKIVGINVSRNITKEINKSFYKKYPNQSGKVYVQFLLDKKGKVNVIKTKRTKGIYLEYENQLIKALKQIPLQKPIYYHNQLISVKFTIPIVIASTKDIKYKN